MDLRYERKYRLPDRGHSTIRQLIHTMPAHFVEHFPDRQVNNVYFDTPELKTYHENVMGVPERSKYRLRWYGTDMKQICNPNFEIKSKHGELGYKVVSRWIGAFPLIWDSLSHEINHRWNGSLHLDPSLVNCYERSYFISADQYFRLTIDRNIKYYPVFKSKRLTHQALHEPIIIVEIKYDHAHEQLANQLFKQIPFRQTKNSKYVNGLMMTCS